jgi:hypothetical protein
MTGMAFRIADSSRDAHVIELTGPDGSRSLVRISAAAANVFRLQVADADGRFDGQGVSQFLASLPGVTVKTDAEPIDCQNRAGW